MKKPNITPGPWELDGRFNVNTGRELYVLANNRDATAVELSANAKLIASAPQMLDALMALYEDALDRGETKDDDGNKYADWQGAREALEAAGCILK